MILVNGVICLHCDAFIYSRMRHDMHDCICGSCSIDGGFDYTRISGDLANMCNAALYLPVTKELLMDDWRLSKDRHGVLTSKQYKEALRKSNAYAASQARKKKK